MIKIFGTLYDNSMDHTVAYANQLYDANWQSEGAKQDVINSYLKNKVDDVQKCKGLFQSIEQLNTSIPSPEEGQWAIVNVDGSWIIYNCLEDGVWNNTEVPYDINDISLDDYMNRTELENTFVNINDLATVDGHSLINGGQNIKINHPETTNNGSIEYSIVTSQQDGLMSSSMYNQFIQIQNDITQIEHDIEVLQTLISDDSDLQNIIEKYTAIKEFIDSLNPNDSITDQILTSIADLQILINNEKNKTTQLENRVTALENRTSNGDGFKHVVLTQSQYDQLAAYARNTIYFIVESNIEDTTVWRLGDNLPIILSGQDTNSETRPDQEQDTIWKFGSKFPVKFT